MRTFATSAAMAKDDAPTPSNGAKPTLHDGKKDDVSKEKAKEVEQHNKEFDQKHDKARDGDEGEPVSKEFWQGTLPAWSRKT